MADVVIFEPGKLPVYLTSVNTPDHMTRVDVTKDQAHLHALPTVVINPDLSAVQNVPTKHWQRGVGPKLRAANAAERAAADLLEQGGG